LQAEFTQTRDLDHEQITPSSKINIFNDGVSQTLDLSNDILSEL